MCQAIISVTCIKISTFVPNIAHKQFIFYLVQYTHENRIKIKSTFIRYVY